MHDEEFRLLQMSENTSKVGGKEMFCRQCGTQVPEDVKICPNCGASVGQNFVPAENTGMGEVPPVQFVQNAGVGQIPMQPVQNAGAGQIPMQQAQNPGAGMGFGQQGYVQPNQQMYGGVPMQGYQMQQPNMGNFGAAFKSVPGEFAGRVKRMGIGVFCLLGIIAAMLFLAAPFMNFASIHVNEKVDVPSYYSDDYRYLLGERNSSGSKLNIKASIGLNLFELSQLSGTIERLADKVGGTDTSTLANMLEMSESYIVREMEDEMETSINDGSVKEVFGTAILILKGRVAALVTPWVLIVCGVGLLVFTVVNRRILRLVFSLVPLACLIWLIICSSHFFSIMGIGAWAIVLGIVLGLISSFKDA